VKKILLSLSIIWCTFASFSQHIFDNNQSIEFRPKVGFLIAHHMNMAHLIKSHFFSGELSYCIQTKGKHYWQKSYKYPTFGASIIFVYTGNPQVIGNGFGSILFIKLPFVQKERVEFNAKIGGGLGYLTKRFNQLENPKNVAIGSHLNLLINFALDLTFKFKKGYLGFGIDFSHFSNSGTVLPNLGLNIPSVSVIYGFQTKKQPLLNPDFKPINRNWSMQLTANFSAHQVFPTGGKLHPVYAVTAYMNKRFNEKSGMFMGIDFLYNEALNHKLGRSSPVIWDVLQTGAFIAYDLNINKLKIYLGMGIYLKNDLNPNGLFYHKIGIRYEFSEHFYANIAVKTHWAQANYLECGIGYKLFVKK